MCQYVRQYGNFPDNGIIPLKPETPMTAAAAALEVKRPSSTHLSIFYLVLRRYHSQNVLLATLLHLPCQQ